MLRFQPYALQQPGHALLCRLATCHVMYQQRLHNREADGQPRVQRSVRILEDKLDIAPQVLQRRAFQLVYLTAVKGDGAVLAVHQL
ncbi:hypothetical protein D3C80_1910650 [compost metagenome]